MSNDFQISGKCLSTRGVIPSCKCDTKLPTNGPPVVSVGDKTYVPGNSLWPFWDGEFTWPFGKVAGDLQLRDQKVTLTWQEPLEENIVAWKLRWFCLRVGTQWWVSRTSCLLILIISMYGLYLYYLNFHLNYPKCIDNDLGWSKCIVAKFISIPPRRWTLKNSGLEDEFPFPRVYYQVNHVNLPGCIIHNLQGYSNTAHSAEGSVHAEVTVPLLFKRWHAIL